LTSDQIRSAAGKRGAMGDMEAVIQQLQDDYAFIQGWNRKIFMITG